MWGLQDSSDFETRIFLVPNIKIKQVLTGSQPQIAIVRMMFPLPKDHIDSIDFLDLFDSIHRISLVLNEIEGYHRFVGEKLVFWICVLFLKKGGWKTILSYWGPVTFHGRTAKLWGGYAPFPPPKIEGSKFSFQAGRLTQLTKNKIIRIGPCRSSQLVPNTKKGPPGKVGKETHTHRIHVWHICLHLVDFYGR